MQIKYLEDIGDWEMALSTKIQDAALDSLQPQMIELAARQNEKQKSKHSPLYREKRKRQKVNIRG